MSKTEWAETSGTRGTEETVKRQPGLTDWSQRRDKKAKMAGVPTNNVVTTRRYKTSGGGLADWRRGGRKTRRGGRGEPILGWSAEGIRKNEQAGRKNGRQREKRWQVKYESW